MNHAVLLSPAVKRYDWGSPTEIPRLFGIPNPELSPIAELWYGTHPDGATQVEAASGTLAASCSLSEYLQSAPERLLGAAVHARYGQTLPFLLKVISAADPLSLQAHPSKAQAEAGYAREQEQGVALESPQRNYRDTNHKPELITALTPFDALVGFRSPEAVSRLCAPLGSAAHVLYRAAHGARGGGLLRELYDTATRFTAAEVDALVSAVRQLGVEHRAQPLQAMCYRTILRLADKYPGDAGVLAPLYLNVLSLEPGEAVYLPAAVLHAYISGVGVEIMANSNNVLRGGLTSKHIDRQELRNVLLFEPYEAPLLSPAPDSTVTRYGTPFEEFTLEMHRLGNSARAVPKGPSRPEILLCTAGELSFSGGNKLRLKAGQAVFVPSALSEYTLRGPATVYRASSGNPGR